MATLSAKHDLALAALDMESDVKEVALASGIEELKRRLEVLLGAKPHAAVDESEKQRQQQEAEHLARRERVAETGSQLLTAALTLLGEMIPQDEPTHGAARMAPKLVSVSAWSVTGRADPGSRLRCRTKPCSSSVGGLAAHGAGSLTNKLRDLKLHSV